MDYFDFILAFIEFILNWFKSNQEPIYASLFSEVGLSGRFFW
jgi:hypothetical protein